MCGGVWGGRGEGDKPVFGAITSTFCSINDKAIVVKEYVIPVDADKDVNHDV